MNEELEKLKANFTDDEIRDSWFYTFLQNKMYNIQKPSKKVVMKIEAKDENELRKLKLNLINEGLKLARPEKKSEWLSFTEKNINNPYYINIIEIALYLVKYEKTFNNPDIFSELKKINLSGIQIVFLKSLIDNFFDIEFKLDEYKVEQKPNLI